MEIILELLHALLVLLLMPVILRFLALPLAFPVALLARANGRSELEDAAQYEDLNPRLKSYLREG
jgi:hypothetical protein